jgi:Protein of unknown function (DUF1549)/Protein of unknown function (DUF1553)
LQERTTRENLRAQGRKMCGVVGQPFQADVRLESLTYRPPRSSLGGFASLHPSSLELCCLFDDNRLILMMIEDTLPPNHPMMRYLLLATAWLVLPLPGQAQEPVSFRQEVMAVLSRAGCNQGTCHGNLHGKGGFKLSLRGEDPGKDYDALTREHHGRRVNRLQADESLILQKATARVPHEGGQRFPLHSSEYEILERWITQGARGPSLEKAPPVKLLVEPAEQIVLAPTQEIQVRAWAIFGNGARKDVSRLAVFESTNPKVDVSRQGLVTSDLPGETTIVVRYLHLQNTSLLAFVPSRPDFKWSNPRGHNYVDDLVFARLQKLRMNPSDVCTDSEFVRRASLDLLGLLPSAKETRAFLADKRDDRRSRLIDALLERPEFAEFWALKWADVLRNEEKQLDKKGVTVFYDWIRQSIARNKPLNQFAHELIASRGSTYKVPPANYYRALRDPHTRAEATAQVFLGIRMQCARCHNHPFNQWTQNDYHQFAALFPRVQYKLLDNTRKDKLDKHEFIGEQIVYMDDTSEVKHPYTDAVMKPRLLGGPTLKLGPKDDRLVRLADWVADPKNPFFARAQANRIWAYLFGQGLVDPIDDFRQTNPPANGPLLEALAKDLADRTFDQKHLIRTIMNSRTYQASAKPNETNADDESNGSHTLVRSLPAEALLDAIAQVTQTPLKFDGYPNVKRAGHLPAMPQIRRSESFQGPFRFLRTFGKPERLLSCDCERSDATTLAQALQMTTGDIINKAVANPDNRVGKLLAAKKSNADIIEELFLASLCRFPMTAETASLVRRVEMSTDRREALEDVLWGLLNSKEFLLRK